MYYYNMCIGVGAGNEIDAAFFKDDVSSEHALDLLKRYYPDMGTARAFVNTLGEARTPGDDTDGHPILCNSTKTITFPDMETFLCEAEYHYSDIVFLYTKGEWTVYRHDDMKKAMQDYANRIGIDYFVAVDNLHTIRSILAHGGGVTEINLLADIGNMIGMELDYDMFNSVLRKHGSDLLRIEIDGLNKEIFTRHCLIEDIIHLYAEQAWREGAIRGFSESHEGFNADYADGYEDPDVGIIVSRWENPYHR